METLLLSRIQFAANISFHILFPTITIALGWVLLFFKLRFNATADAKWMDLYRFWVKVFALSFALVRRGQQHERLAALRRIGAAHELQLPARACQMPMPV